MNWFSYSDSMLLANGLSSLIYLAAILILRVALVRAVRHQESLPVENRRRWLVIIRNVLFFIAVSGLVFIWANEVRGFAVSLVAVAAAIAIATRELIICVSGAVLRAGTNAYSVGDWIELGGTRGHVISCNLLGSVDISS